MEALRWAVSLFLGVPSALLILLNWLTVVGAIVEAFRRGRSRDFSLCLPILSGIAGAVACLVCPWPGAWRWAWVPLLLDPSISLLLMASVLHLVARAFLRGGVAIRRRTTA